MQVCDSKPNQYYYSRRTKLAIIISSSVTIVYIFVSLLLVRSKLNDNNNNNPRLSLHVQTDLRHIFFAIASSAKTWPARKHYLETWWNSDHNSQTIRGCVFLDQNDNNNNKNDNDSEPPKCVSEDTSPFRYTNKWGRRSEIRVARMVSEAVRLVKATSGSTGDEVRWFVFGDEDTVFFPENLAKTLSKYDHELWYYVGTYSESYEQNKALGFGMAFGGAGFAVSCRLGEVLAKVLDSCIERYHYIYGGDSRVYSCVSELGVQLTHEPGFHQVDIRGDIFGILTTHPNAPLVSLHNLDYSNPIFPNMSSQNRALKHLFEAVKVDSQRILQQSVCYDKWFSWTIVVSWGYAVQIHSAHVPLPDLVHVPLTFRGLNDRPTPLSGVYTFATKELHPDPCRRPSVLFFDNMTKSNGIIETTYRKHYVNCTYDSASPKKIEMVRVFSRKLELDIKQLHAPRRHCCDVLPSATASASNVLEIAIRECNDDELIHMH